MDISLWICHGDCCVKSFYVGQNATDVGDGGKGERWWVCTVGNICIYTIFIWFFRLNVNRYTALRYNGLISEPLLNYLVRWKWLHIRPITGIKLFGYSKYTITCSKTQCCRYYLLNTYANKYWPNSHLW